MAPLKIRLGQWHQSLQHDAEVKTSHNINATASTESSSHRMPLQQFHLLQHAFLLLKRTEQIEDIKWRQRSLSATSTDGCYKLERAHMISKEILLAQSIDGCVIYINLRWLWDQVLVDRSLLMDVSPKLTDVQSIDDLSCQIQALINVEHDTAMPPPMMLLHHPYILSNGKVIVGKRFILDIGL